MTVKTEDYRTNRADYAIAAHGRKTADDDDREEELAAKKRSLWLRDRRTTRLTANPSESLPGPKARLRAS
ncbi:hypothetical protein NKJ71_17695 [Mesorhizobium sp. M0050]|uniref:hypothetical protein n=1 Tax=unclassified Mesorhizobium TaxID=325217 RepID=UPI0033379DB5